MFKQKVTFVRYTTAKKANNRKSNNVVAMTKQTLSNVGLKYEDDSLKVHWLAMISTICFFTTYALQIVALFNAKGDLKSTFDCFSVMTFCSMGILKLISLHQCYNHWKTLLNKMTDLEKELTESTSNEDYESDEDNDSLRFPDYIDTYTKKFQGVSNVLNIMYASTAIIYISFPFVEHAITIFLGKDVRSLPHILQGWTPLDYCYLGYATTIVIEIVSAIYCVSVHGVFDLTVIGIMIFICGQFSLLHDYSKNIAGNGSKCTLSNRRDDRALRRIVRSYKIHILINNICDDLGSLLQNMMGAYFSIATLTICSVAIRINSELSSMELVSLLQYLCGNLTQLYLLCHFGDNVLNQSAVGVGQGPFGAAYWCLSPRVRRELAILGMGMMIPKYFKAGPFVFISLPSFIQVIRTAYSYFAVVRNYKT